MEKRFRIQIQSRLFFRNTNDFIFIDADKKNFGYYFNDCLKLVSNRGTIAIDNIFRKGQITENNPCDIGTKEIKNLINRIINDPHLYYCIVPIGDGVMLVNKKFEED